MTEPFQRGLADFKAKGLGVPNPYWWGEKRGLWFAGYWQGWRDRFVATMASVTPDDKSYPG